MAVPVQLEITANTRQIEAELRRLQAQLREVNTAAGAGFSGATRHAETFQNQLRSMIGRFSQMWALYKSAQAGLGIAKTGIDFNATLENARLGMAALISSQMEVRSATGELLNAQGASADKQREAITATMTLADDQIRQLRVAGLQTAATTEQLLGAMQDALGPGLAAGIPIDKIRELTIVTVQAAQAMQVPMNQLNQEIRSMLAGTVDRNSRVATILFGSPGEANKQIKEWKAAGTLADNLLAKMASFSAAGKESMNNWSVMLSNIQEAGQLFLGEAFKDPMGDLKRNLNEILTGFFDLNTASTSETFRPLLEMTKDLARMFGDVLMRSIAGLIDMAQRLAVWWGENRVELMALGRTVTDIAGGALGVFLSIIGTIGKHLIGFAAWINGLNGALRALSVGGIVAAMIAMRSMGMTMVNAGMAVGPLTGLLRGLKSTLTDLFYVMRGAGTWGNFATNLRQLITPTGLAIAAIGALAAVYMTLANNAKKAREAILDAAKASRETMSRAASLQAEARAQERVKDDKRRTQAERDAAQKNLDTIRAQMVEIDASFKKFNDTKVSEAIAKWAGSTQAATSSVVADLERKLAFMRDAKAQLAEFNAAVARGRETEVVIGRGSVERGKVVDGREMTEKEIAARRVLIEQGKQFAQEEIKNTAEALEQARERLKISGGIVQTEEKLDVKAKARGATDKEINDQIKERGEQSRVALILENARMRAMERGTIDEREARAVAQERLRLLTDMAAIRKGMAKEASQDEIDAMAELTRQFQALESGKSEIHSRFAQERADLFQSIDDMATKNSLDKYRRKLFAIEQEVDKLAKSYEEKLGKPMPKEMREKLLGGRREEASVENMSAVTKQANLEMGIYQKQSGQKLGLQEQIAWLKEWGASHKLAAEDVDKLTEALDQQAAARDSWQGGLERGMVQVRERWADTSKQLQESVVSMVNGVESAFANFFTMMTERGTTAGQKWDALWKGMAGSTVQALTRIMAAKAAEWAFDKAKLAWDRLKLAWNTIAAAWRTKDAAKSVAESAQKATANTMETGTEVGKAASKTFSAHDSIPWVVIAMAVAMVALMMSTMKSVKAYAVGGLINQPTLAMMGEAGPEVVAPERDFKHWAGSYMRIGANIATAQAPRPSVTVNEIAALVAELEGDRRGIVDLRNSTWIGDSLSSKRMLAGILRDAKMMDDGATG